MRRCPGGTWWGLPGLFGLTLVGCLQPTPPGEVRPDPGRDLCGTGTWQPGTLELHHIYVGQGDATLLVGPDGHSLLVDVGEERWDSEAGARLVGARVQAVLGCRHLDQVLITHFHLDHVGYPGRGGLWHLVNRQGFRVGRLLHRDLERYRGQSGGTLGRWRAYLGGAGRALLHPEVVREEHTAIALGPGVTVRVVAADGHGRLRPGDLGADLAPPSENDYSIALFLRFGRFDYFLGGDLSGERLVSPQGYSYHDIETAVAAALPDVDVLRVNHHGSEHSSNPTFLAQVAAEVAIVSAGNDNPFGHPDPAAVARLRAGAALYLTGGDPYDGETGVVVRTADGLTYSVNGDLRQATDPPRVDGDGDGWFREADPDDGDPGVGPAPRGGCDGFYQSCGGG